MTRRGAPPSGPPSGIVTLLTDFGLDDAYVGVVKGAILGIHPAVRLVDLTHGVPPQDVRHGALVLTDAYQVFPPGTVHLAVVDPGVGTRRRALALQADGMIAAPERPSTPTTIAAPASGPQPSERAEELREDLDLQTFFSLGYAASRSTSIVQLGDELWTQLRKHLPASAFVLYGYDEATDAIIAVHKAGDDTNGISAQPIPLGDRLSGWVAATPGVGLTSCVIDCPPVMERAAARTGSK